MQCLYAVETMTKVTDPVINKRERIFKKNLVSKKTFESNLFSTWDQIRNFITSWENYNCFEKNKKAFYGQIMSTKQERLGHKILSLQYIENPTYDGSLEGTQWLQSSGYWRGSDIGKFWHQPLYISYVW